MTEVEMTAAEREVEDAETGLFDGDAVFLTAVYFM